MLQHYYELEMMLWRRVTFNFVGSRQGQTRLIFQDVEKKKVEYFVRTAVNLNQQL